VTERNEVRVVCPHHTVWTFVASSVPAVWIINVQGAEWVTYPDGLEAWHYSMRCDQCGLNVPVVKPANYGPILDRLAAAGVTEVPLWRMARALGALPAQPD
jgi:hypothetical protein